MCLGLIRAEMGMWMCRVVAVCCCGRFVSRGGGGRAAVGGGGVSCLVSCGCSVGSVRDLLLRLLRHANPPRMPCRGSVRDGLGCFVAVWRVVVWGPRRRPCGVVLVRGRCCCVPGVVVACVARGRVGLCRVVFGVLASGLGGRAAHRSACLWWSGWLEVK